MQFQAIRFPRAGGKAIALLIPHRFITSWFANGRVIARKISNGTFIRNCLWVSFGTPFRSTGSGHSIRTIPTSRLELHGKPRDHRTRFFGEEFRWQTDETIRFQRKGRVPELLGYLVSSLSSGNAFHRNPLPAL